MALNQRKIRKDAAKNETIPPIVTNVYALPLGVLYTRQSLVQKVAVRRSVTIALTVSREPLQIRTRNEEGSYGAVVIKPLIRHVLSASDVGLVVVMISPDHPLYPVFRTIASPGVQAIDRGTYTPLEEKIRAAYEGKLTAEEVEQLFEDIIAATATTLPQTKPIDARVKKIMDLLESNPGYSPKELAAAVNLSYFRVSHLFADSLGLSLRSYQLSRKLYYAGRLLETGYTVAQTARLLGFSNIEHLRRVYRDTYGAPPSYIYHNPGMRYFRLKNSSRLSSFLKALESAPSRETDNVAYTTETPIAAF